LRTVYKNTPELNIAQLEYFIDFRFAFRCRIDKGLIGNCMGLRHAADRCITVDTGIGRHKNPVISRNHVAGPALYSPINHPEKYIWRRNIILEQMARHQSRVSNLVFNRWTACKSRVLCAMGNVFLELRPNELMVRT